MLLRFFKRNAHSFFQNIKGVYEEEEEEERNKKKRRQGEEREIEDSGTHFCLDFLAH